MAGEFFKTIKNKSGYEKGPTTINNIISTTVHACPPLLTCFATESCLYSKVGLVTKLNCQETGKTALLYCCTTNTDIFPKMETPKGLRLQL